MVTEDRKYTQDHEWVKVDGDVVTVGVTDFAQEQLTDIVFVELPEVGRKVSKGDAVVVLESVKSVADVYAPCDGEVSEVNSALEDSPEKVNDDAFGDGWLFKLKADEADWSDLMDAATYQKFIDEQAE